MIGTDSAAFGGMEIDTSPLFEVSGDLDVWLSHQAAVNCDEKYFWRVTDSTVDGKCISTLIGLDECQIVDSVSVRGVWYLGRLYSRRGYGALRNEGRSFECQLEV